MKKLVFGCALVCAACAMSATEITFTGADASNPTNLASAANWSAAPGADTVGVIDSASVAGYVVNADLALAGLKITGTKTVTIGGAATLTLGADGILRTGAGSLILRCPMATSAAQAWDIADGTELDIYSSITGTADLLIRNFKQYAQHYATVNYDGQITYTKSSTSMDNKWILYCAVGKWASTVKVSTAIPVFIRPPADGMIVKWSDVFPVNQPYLGNSSAYLNLAMNNGASAEVRFEDGDSLTFSSGSKPYYMPVCGIFRQTGGTISKEDQYFLTVGNHSANPQWTYDLRSIYLMEGGNLNVGTVLVGYNTQESSGDNVYFRQTGGKVKAPYSSAVGGGIQVGGGVSKHYTVAEYRMDGGTLDMSNAFGGSPALALASPRANNTTMPAAGFVMTGGTVYANWLTFGSDQVFWGEKLSKIANGYGLLDISGGEFQIYRYYTDTAPDGWVRISSSWNSDAAASNCVYSVKLHGGKVKMVNDSQYAWPLLTCLPKSAVGTSLGYDNKDYCFSAPLYGTGVLRKDGTGTLLVKDAARFTGNVEVNAGTLEIESGDGEDIDADKCFRWLASSLSGLADKATVEAWADVNFGVVAATNDNPKYNTRSYRQGGPVFKAKGVNSRPSVSFDGTQSITVPTAANPLWGRTSCTVVAVVKPNANSSQSLGRYNRPVLSVMPGSSIGYVSFGGFGNNGGTAGWRPGVGRRWRGDSYSGTDAEKAFIGRDGVSFNDGEIHAFAITVKGNEVMIAGDGDVTNDVWTVNSTVAPFGWYNTGYHNPAQDAAMGRLFFGGHVVDNVDGAFYSGDILELRVYTNRLFTADEQLKVTKHLLAQYGGDKRMMKYAKAPRATGAPGAFTRSYVAPTPVATTASWDADDIDAADGASVTSWASEDGQKIAGTADTGAAGTPTLVKDAINGHAALRFEGSLKQALAIPAAASPISGASGYTAALVWRTESAGVSATSAGLLSSHVSGGTSNFSLYYFNRSAVSATIRDSAGNTDAKTRKPYNLNDGETHITILSCEAATKKYLLMTDGCFLTGSLVGDAARSSSPVQIGSFLQGATDAKYYFTGDIAAVKLYDKALTQAEMRDLGEYWAQKYATQLLVGYKYTPAHLRESGLGATNISVAAGARLSMPLSDTAPFTMTRGTLSGAGEFIGTYRLQGSAALDASAVAPSVLDELNLAGGATVKVSKDAFGSLSVRRLVVSGANAVDISAGSAVPGRRETILTYDEAEIDPDATWTVVGGDTNMSVVHDPANRRLVLYTKFGMAIIVR